MTLGQIESTLYRTASTSGPAAGIYVLGDANTDTDEYDQHVIAHEFHHFIEDTISRTDTTGGSHSPDERLDLRLAFSEGFANAFSAMVLNDPLYSDSLGSQQSLRFSFSLESNAASPAGWYNEGSIQSITWDLYDAAADASDSVSIGYRPMYEALTGPLRGGAALTSVFPFVDYLKGRAGAPVAAINTLVTSQSIHVADEWASTETNNGFVPQALPIYTQLTLNGGFEVRVRHDRCGDVQQDRQPAVPAVLDSGGAFVTVRARTRLSGRRPRSRQRPIRISCCTRTASSTSRKPRRMVTRRSPGRSMRANT